MACLPASPRCSGGSVPRPPPPPPGLLLNPGCRHTLRTPTARLFFPMTSLCVQGCPAPIGTSLPQASGVASRVIEARRPVCRCGSERCKRLGAALDCQSHTFPPSTAAALLGLMDAV